MQGDGVTVKPLGGGFHEFRWTEKSIGATQNAIPPVIPLIYKCCNATSDKR